MVWRDENPINEADEVQHLRRLLVSNMGLDDTVNDKTGEDITLDQLDLNAINRKLTDSALWEKLGPEAQDAFSTMMRQPDNKRLADLLDAICDHPLQLDKVITQDAPTTPQKTLPKPPNPANAAPAV